MELSDILNFIAIAPCLFGKLPQISLLLTTRNASGISFEGIILEMFSHVNVSGFSYYQMYPLMQYLEYPILGGQNAALVAILGLVTGRLARSGLWLTLYMLFFFSFGVLDRQLALSIVGLNSIISASGKFAQINEIRKSLTSDNVSFAAFVISVLSSIARVSALVLTGAGENVIFFNLATSILANLAVIFTISQFRTKKDKTA